MSINDILPKLQKVKKNQKGWVALCPSHEDRNPSLSISEKDGKILLNCFAGCRIENIVSALGMEMKELFSENTNNFRPKTQPKKIVAQYDYADESGEILYQNVRYDPKRFSQRRPDGKGGYIYSLQGVRRVPYRLAELIHRDTESIFLTEGEKDCDNIRKLGLTASSFKKWSPEFNQFISNADVTLLIDHDQPGIRQAEEACRTLSGNVQSLKLVDLYHGDPIPEKNGRDVSDYIDSCKREENLTDEEIAEIICKFAEASENYEPNYTNIENPMVSAADFESCLTVKPANDWLNDAKTRPQPKMLFGELWHEGEICILFADTNLGKSILAVQIANSIAKGSNIRPFKSEIQPQKVVYFDFELSDKQFETRYAEKLEHTEFCTNHYHFSTNFLRGEINPESELPDRFRTFEEFLNFSIEYLLAESEAKILIVDNLTYLRTETEKAKDALPLMKELKRLKRKFDLSILALAHTPKRELSKPLTRNDLQGSKMLINFCDSSFAIGESTKDKNLRYLKQIKERNTAKLYDADNICIFQIEKPTNFLQFDFIEFGKESEHLNQISEKDKEALIEQMKELLRQGKTQREIGNIVGVSAMTVNRYLKA